jgi:hypothetical protein
MSDEKQAAPAEVDLVTIDDENSNKTATTTNDVDMIEEKTNDHEEAKLNENDNSRSNNDDSLALDDSINTANKSVNKSMNKSLTGSASKIDKNLQKAMRIELEKKRLEEKVFFVFY